MIRKKDENRVRINIDEVIRSKRRTISLVVTSEARLVIRAPVRTPMMFIEELVEKKKAWITRKQQEVTQRSKVHKEKEYINGEGFMYLGGDYSLKISGDVHDVRLDGSCMIFPAERTENAEVFLKRWYKNNADKIIKERVDFYSRTTGIRYKSVKINNASKRWGSCGPSGSLNFTWRLVMAPIQVIDYVAAHELAHIEFRNHSKEFWKRVGTIIPDFEIWRKWLRENQGLLDLM